MKKYLPLALFALFGLSVQAQTEETPAITLTVGVNGTSRNLTFAATEAGHKLQIDWGDGKLVETEEIAVDDEYSSSTTVSGIAVGDGNIKIYGEGIAMFDCSYAVGTTKVTALDVTNAPDLNELVMNSNEIKTIDLTNNGKLANLTCSNNPITELNLSANTMLENLEATDMQLEAIDLTNNVNLTDVRLNNNKVTELDLSKNTALERAYLLNNLIKDIKLPTSDSFIFLNLTNNQLTTLDLTGCDALTSLYCANNYLTFATLPTAAYKTYTYAPQKPMQIQEAIKTGETLDLSALDNLTGLTDAPQATVYTWATESGTELVKGTDYTEEGGKFTFLKAQGEPVYCSMTTEAFPKFSGTNAFKTTAIEITDGGATVGTPAITLTAEVDGNQREFTFAAAEAGHKFLIDWGDGNPVETEEIPVNTDGWTYTSVYGTPVGEGNVKIYDDGAGITLFWCSSTVSGAQLTALDVTNASDLTELTMNTNKIAEIDLSRNTKLVELICSNNPITALDITANTAMETLDAQNMQLTAIDLSKNTAMKSILLSNNQIGNIDVTACTELTSLILLNNKIAEINVENNTKLSSLNVNNNLLTTLDVTACGNMASLFCLGNEIEELKVGNIKTRLTCNNNRLTPVTLPAIIFEKESNYTYAPQKDMQIQETIKTGETLDLSALDNLTGLADAPQATVYTWTTESGTELVKGTDYTEEGGKFTFLKAQSEPVYCSMTTEAFPKFSGANAFKTTAIEIQAGSVGIDAVNETTPVISGNKGIITVHNLSASSTVEIFDLSGQKVAGQANVEGRVTFSVRPSLYIVCVNGIARKVNAI